MWEDAVLPRQGHKVEPKAERIEFWWFALSVKRSKIIDHEVGNKQ